MSVSPEEPRPTLRIPEAHESEYGDTYWIQGHVDPALALLACVTSTMVNVGAPEALQLLAGGETFGDAHGGWSYIQQLERADDNLNASEHVWLKVDPDDEENMVPADPSEPDAQAWTRVSFDG